MLKRFFRVFSFGNKIIKPGISPYEKVLLHFMADRNAQFQKQICELEHEVEILKLKLKLDDKNKPNNL